MSNNTIKPPLNPPNPHRQAAGGHERQRLPRLLANVSRGKTSSKDLTAEQLEPCCAT